MSSRRNIDPMARVSAGGPTVADAPLFAPPPAAAASDPITSHLAAESIRKSGAQRRQMLEVVELLREFPNRTSLELAAVTGVNRNLIARRLPEAAAVGLVRKCDRRKCRESHYISDVWEPVTGVVGARPPRPDAASRDASG